MPDIALSAYNGGQMVSPAVRTAIKLIKELNEHGIKIEPRAFKVTRMDPEDLKFKLDVEGIPYIEMKTHNTILVSREDALRCWQIESQNQTKGNFLQEYNSKELERIVAKHPSVPNKSILSIKNMNLAEADLFLRKCNKIKKGLLLETEKTDSGKFNISIPEGLLSVSDKEKISEAYLQTQIEISGINTAAKTRNNIQKTVENYENAVKERRFTNILQQMLRDKLYSTGSTLENFGEYLKSFKLQLGYVMDSLREKQPINGFNPELLKTAMQAYRQLPEDTYKYTGAYLRNQQITAKQALSQTVDLSEDKQETHKER